MITAPTVVAPFAVRAWRRLRRAEVPVAPIPAAAPLLAPLVVAGAQVAAAGHPRQEPLEPAAHAVVNRRARRGGPSVG